MSSDIGKLLVVVGCVIAGIGLLIWLGGGRGWLGQLPGDLQIHRGNFRFYFPLMTCLIISILLTLLLWFFRR